MKPKHKQPEKHNGPGFSFALENGSIRFGSNLSPEESLEMQRRLAAGKPELLRGIRKSADELAQLIDKYSSFALVARLWLANGLFNGETYVESESHQRPYCIEYAALIELKNKDYRLKRPIEVQGSDVVRAQKLVEGIFRDSAW
jgi:hypothetical protein